LGPEIPLVAAGSPVIVKLRVMIVMWYGIGLTGGSVLETCL